MSRRSVLGASVAGAMLAACTSRVAADDRLAEVLDRLATEFLRESPETATSLSVPVEQAGGAYMSRLSDPTRAGLTRVRGILEAGLRDLGAIDRNVLSETDQVTLDVVTTSLSDNAADISFEPSARYPYVVSQLTGSYVGIPDFLASQHPITSREQVEGYFSRISAFAGVLDEESRLIASDAGAGLVPPDFAIDRALQQQETFARTPAAQTAIVASFADRLPNVTDIPEAERAALVSRAEALVRDEVLPAYGRQMDALRAIRARATHDAGVWRLPRGDELYATALRVQTTTMMSPDEIHQLGVDLIAQHTSEMDAILRAQGLTRGTVAQRLQEIGRRPDQLYPNTNAGREQCLADLNALVRATAALMPEYFGRQARAQLEIRRIPEYTEAGAPGGYYNVPALDGSRPGVYYINLRDMRELAKFGLPTLTYHEGIPGHHWQFALQQEAEGIPFIRSALMFFAAYSEGWALYTEQLMDEVGVYADNPINRLGYLQSATFRASRLVVDTGIHAKRWTREQAIQSMVEATGDALGPITTEIERYCVWPGQACSYMVGKQAILRARAAAQTALGNRFDLKGFHDTVVGNGATPLSVTESLVQRWTDSVSRS
ncbi:DUF885 domain-containing protein [Candidatus Viadribacter manganicus]|nr:DUF885 family protein [Candidatus Viadribacter manganicus]